MRKAFLTRPPCSYINSLGAEGSLDFSGATSRPSSEVFPPPSHGATPIARPNRPPASDALCGAEGHRARRRAFGRAGAPRRAPLAAGRLERSGRTTPGQPNWTRRSPRRPAETCWTLASRTRRRGRTGRTSATTHASTRATTPGAAYRPVARSSSSTPAQFTVRRGRSPRGWTL